MNRTMRKAWKRDMRERRRKSAAVRLQRGTIGGKGSTPTTTTTEDPYSNICICHITYPIYNTPCGKCDRR